jgi:lipopolysaccharide transport system ATP-binding protein
MKPAIRVRNLSKRYELGARANGYATLRESLSGFATVLRRKFRASAKVESQASTAESFFAIRDVSFDVQPGDVVAVIGRNGAGKSTLLKLLSRITEPTAGTVEMRGRIASLLEVGTGFHPELTGRENIYLNGAILGMTKREIQRKFDEIVAFSEIEQFLDTPVKRYSSGMYVRLAFAVAAHLEPEILVVDEVLAVGDVAFQRKCLGRMQEVSRGGRTVLFVSHNMAAVEALCSHGVFLDHGELVYEGDIKTAIQHYYQKLEDGVAGGRVDLTEAGGRGRLGRLLDSIQLVGDEGRPTSYVRLSSLLELRIGIKTSEPIEEPVIGIGIDDSLGQRALTVHTPISTPSVARLKDRCVVRCCIPQLPLAPGEYWVKIAISLRGRELDAVEKAVQFTVVNADTFGDGRGFQRGYCVAPSAWSVDSSECGF